jgi:DNA-binding NarL/FixJ family response regulator
MRVLLVDDDPLVRRGVARILPRFEVDAVGESRAAMEACRAKPYDAVIIDACLDLDGGRGGLDLARALREDGPERVIVLMSGMQPEDLRVEGDRVGADAAIYKGDMSGPTIRALLEELVALRAGREKHAELADELHALVEDVCDAAAEVLFVDAEYVFRMAVLAQKAYGAADDGDPQFAACARAVGLSRQALQPYVLVAKRWTREELRVLLAERRNVLGKPMSVSHLHLLARLPRHAREEWVERVFSEGLTVSGLQQLLRTLE